MDYFSTITSGQVRFSRFSLGLTAAGFLNHRLDAFLSANQHHQHTKENLPTLCLKETRKL